MYLLVAVLAAVVPARAQIKIHKILTVEDGLVQSQVNAIHEDRRGYVWFSTFGGVSRWDGNDFKNFQTQDGLSDNTVYGILAVYQPRHRSLSHPEHLPETASPLPVGGRIQSHPQRFDLILY